MQTFLFPKSLLQILVMTVFLHCALATGAGADDSAAEAMTVTPETVAIGSFFSGANLTVKAAVPREGEITLRLIGPPENIVVMKKGRVAGLWMNVEEITFHGIPRAYLVWTSSPDSAAAGDNHGSLEFSSILAGSLEGKTPEETSLLIEELVQLKEADNLYRIRPDTLRFERVPDDRGEMIETVLSIPAKLSPGDYTLELVSSDGGSNRLLAAKKIVVELSGLPALVSRMANTRGLLYGIMAVVIAMLSGLLVGFVFRTKSAH